jgi:hypothetical protein
MIAQNSPANPFAIKYILKRLAECDCRPLLARVTDGQTPQERSLVGKVGEVLRCDPETGDIVLRVGTVSIDRAVISGANFQLVDRVRL